MQLTTETSIIEIDTLIQIGHYAKAREKITMSLHSNCCHELYYLIAKIESLEFETEKALHYINKALELDSDNLEYLFNKSRWLINKEKYLETVEVLTDLLAIEKSLNQKYFTETAYFYRAIALCKLGSYVHSREDLSHVRDDMRLFVFGSLCSKAELLQILN